MKKLFFALMLMFASVVALNAQSLTSNTWMTTIPGEDELVVVMNFEADGTCALVVASEEVEEDSGMKMTVNVACIVPGVYDLNGNDLLITFDNSNADVNLDYEIEGVDAQTKKMMDAMIKPELEKQKPELKQSILSSIPQFGAMKVVSVDKEKLVLADGKGVELTFVPTPGE